LTNDMGNDWDLQGYTLRSKMLRMSPGYYMAI
jgi:hypothetical protein